MDLLELCELCELCESQELKWNVHKNTMGGSHSSSFSRSSSLIDSARLTPLEAERPSERNRFSALKGDAAELELARTCEYAAASGESFVSDLSAPAFLLVIAMVRRQR